MTTEKLQHRFRLLEHREKTSLGDFTSEHKVFSDDPNPNPNDYSTISMRYLESRDLDEDGSYILIHLNLDPINPGAIRGSAMYEKVVPYLLDGKTFKRQYIQQYSCSIHFEQDFSWKYDDLKARMLEVANKLVSLMEFK